MSSANTSGTPSPFVSATATEPRIAPPTSVETAPLAKACSPACSGGGAPRTGQPGSSDPSRSMACTKPSLPATISSFLLSPFRSASTGEDSPSPVGVPVVIAPLVIAFGKPVSMLLSCSR